MCEKCNELFDIKDNLPYLMPCGHSICERCFSSLEYKNNKIECPIDLHIYEITKDKIPKNEMLIDYMQYQKFGPNYSYQIRECLIEEARFFHIIRRNCCQKLCHFLYKLLIIKLFFPLLNKFLWPFKKMIHIIKALANIFYLVFIKVKNFLFKIINKIKSIRIPNIYCKCCYKLKEKFINFRIIKTVIKFFKYTIRAPLWINYLKIMKNLLVQSKLKDRNTFIKIIHTIFVLIAIIAAHYIAYILKNLDSFFILILLLNESIIVLTNFMKMDEEKYQKKYLNKNKKNFQKNKRKNEFGMMKNNTFDEEEEQYYIDENKYNRGKKCIIRWIGFILFWYFYPSIYNSIFNFLKYRKISKHSDTEINDNSILIGIIKYLFIIPKLLIVIYLTC